ncbi:dihydrofolate reductase family protein [Sphingomonas sp. I4]
MPPGGESWADAYVASGDLGEEIAALKAEPGGPIIAHGGVRFARSLIEQRLVDRFALLVMPVALGRGEALFSELDAPLALHLVEAIRFPGGAIAQIYRPG